MPKFKPDSEVAKKCVDKADFRTRQQQNRDKTGNKIRETRETGNKIRVTRQTVNKGGSDWEKILNTQKAELHSHHKR